MTEANGKALFLDAKLKHEPHEGCGYETSTIPLSEPDTAREALETLREIVGEWLHAVAIAATSDARSAIPIICTDLDRLIETTVEAVLTGTWTCGVDAVEESWKRLQAAGEAVALDAVNWESEIKLVAAATLFKAARRGRGMQAACRTAAEVATQH